jgi:hypothetical protein
MLKKKSNVEEEWCRGTKGRMTLKRNMNKRNIWSNKSQLTTTMSFVNVDP